MKVVFTLDVEVTAKDPMTAYKHLSDALKVIELYHGMNLIPNF